MNDPLPQDRQAVQVRIHNRDWQPATYQHGQFVDVYGLPLDPQEISGWRPAETTHSSQ